MIDIIMIGVLGGIISSYKIKNETYLKNFLKGIIVGIISFLIRFIPDYFNNNIMSIEKSIAALLLCLGIGGILGLFFMFSYSTRKE